MYVYIYPSSVFLPLPLVVQSDWLLCHAGDIHPLLYIMLRACDVFYEKAGHYPGHFDEAVGKDTAELRGYYLSI